MTIKNLYGIDFTPDAEQMRIRDKKIKALKKEMGDKYLLAKAMPRLTKEK